MPVARLENCVLRQHTPQSKAGLQEGGAQGAGSQGNPGPFTVFVALFDSQAGCV